VDSHECQCDVVNFTNDSGCDSITGNVCIARDSSGGLYNSQAEAEFDRTNGSCDSGSPALTEWASVPCADAVDNDFGPWNSQSFAWCYPPDVIADLGCVRLTDGSNESWDVITTDWCVGEGRGGGCFSYIRSHNVPDGQACN
jgi:hypothetical protein